MALFMPTTVTPSLTGALGNGVVDASKDMAVSWQVNGNTPMTAFQIVLYKDGVEITESEYNAMLSEIREKAALVDKLYSGEITIDDVPADWKEEIQRRVDERIAAESEVVEQDISGDEFLSMMEAVL